MSATASLGGAVMTSATKRGPITEEQKLARRERRILKRVATYVALMEQEESRREYLIEMMWDRVESLEWVSPDGTRPSTFEATVRWAKLREDLYAYKVEFDAMGPREGVAS